MNHWPNFYHDATAEQLDGFVALFKEVEMFRRHWPRQDLLKLIANPVFQTYAPRTPLLATYLASP